MDVILIMLGFAFIFLSIYFLISTFITKWKLKKHQKEWDLVKDQIIKIFPNTTTNDLWEYYELYINSIDGYYPRPNIKGGDSQNG